MRTSLATCAIAIALAAAPLSAHALGKNEKGCLAGGAIGGLGGHFLGSGNHALLGAAAGCAVGTVVAKKRAEKDSRAQAAERSKHARYTPREPRRVERPVTERNAPLS